MSSSDEYFAYAATYDNSGDAETDFGTFRDIASAGVVGKYDAAIVTKDDAGKVHVQKHGTAAKSGAWKGVIAGGVASLLFPPSLLVGGVIGGAAGALAGKLWGGMSRSDLKDLGEMMDAGESGLIILGESKLDEYIDKGLKRAKKHIRKEIRADRKDVEKYLKDLESE